MPVLLAAWLFATHDFSARAEPVVQALGADYVAVEAEAADSFTSSAAVHWAVVEDAGVSGGRAIVARGGSTLVLPGGIATYRIRFSQPGAYVLYTRWKSDPGIAAENPFSANSFSYPLSLGSAPQWTRSLANEIVVPESLVLNWTEEFVEYHILPEDVAAGTPFVFLLGTREEGLILDRVVLRRGRRATPGILDALVNSPAASTVLTIESAVADHQLQSVTIRFSEPLDAVAATNFASADLIISGAVIDPADPRQVILATPNQTEGSEYTLSISDLAGPSRAPILPGSTASFRAARIISGWVNAAFFADFDSEIPSHSQALDEFEHSSAAAFSGRVELKSYFIPDRDGRYNLYIRHSGPIKVNLKALDGLATIAGGNFEEPSETFHEGRFIGTSFLIANDRYLLTATLNQTSGPVYLSLAARLSGAMEDPAALAPLSGSFIAALLNPHATDLQILEEPASVSIMGGQSATFGVQAAASLGPIYYQWQLNGANIFGATNSFLITPVLTAADSGGKYRVQLRAGGQITSSQEGVITVSPGNLGIRRENDGLAIHWGVGAAGAILETSAGVGANAAWTPVPGFDPLTSEGWVAVGGPVTRFFRLRK
jgi:hypothetical protein